MNNKNTEIQFLKRKNSYQEPLLNEYEVLQQNNNQNMFSYIKKNENNIKIENKKLFFNLLHFFIGHDFTNKYNDDDIIELFDSSMSKKEWKENILEFGEISYIKNTVKINNVFLMDQLNFKFCTENIYRDYYFDINDIDTINNINNINGDIEKDNFIMLFKCLYWNLRFGTIHIDRFDISIDLKSQMLNKKQRDIFYKKDDIIEIQIFLSKLDIYTTYTEFLDETIYENNNDLMNVKKKIFQKHNFLLAVPSNTSINFLDDKYIQYMTRVNHIPLRQNTICGLDQDEHIDLNYEGFLNKIIEKITEYIKNLDINTIVIPNTSCDSLKNVFTYITVYGRNQKKIIYNKESSVVFNEKLSEYNEYFNTINLYDCRTILVDYYDNTYKLLVGFNLSKFAVSGKQNNYFTKMFKNDNNNNSTVIQYGDKKNLCIEEESVASLSGCLIFSMDIIINENSENNVKLDIQYQTLIKGSMTP